jgi:hypothetical protein
MSKIERERKRKLMTADLAGAPEQRREPATAPRTGRPERPETGREVPIAREDSTERPAPLFSSDEAGKLRADWDSLQIGFVDEPRGSVEKADELVARVMKRLAEIFGVAPLRAHRRQQPQRRLPTGCARL